MAESIVIPLLSPLPGFILTLGSLSSTTLLLLSLADLLFLAVAGTETVTALQGLCDAGGLTKGNSVLILSASGSVGLVAIQIGKQLEASHVAGSRVQYE